MENKNKKPYTKPKIVYEKRIETLAAVCNSRWVGAGGTCCMKQTCQKRSS